MHRHPDLDPTGGTEEPAEYSLRPQRLQEYIGQEKVKARIEIALQAATRRGRPLGSAGFVTALARERPGPWVARPRGRPRKAPAGVAG